MGAKQKKRLPVLKKPSNAILTTLLLITIGYTEFDLGITELHFEIASGKSITNFKNLILDVK